MKHRIIYWSLGLSVLCIAGSVLMFFLAGYFLSISSQQAVQADLIVVLGGDNGSRVIKAADLFKEGLAPHVLLTGMEDGQPATRAHYLNWRTRFLIDRGVSEDTLMFDAISTNSWEEAVNTLGLMRERHWQRVLVVSDPPHLRRLAWVWGKVFEGSGKEYRLIAAPMEGWDAGNWWQNEKSAHYVVTELIKLVYYTIAH